MATDLFDTTQQQDDQQQPPALPTDFYRGLSFLGKPTAISLAGQEPPLSELSAGGAPVGPVAADATPTTPFGRFREGAGERAGGGAGGVAVDLGRALKAAGLADASIGAILKASGGGGVGSTGGGDPDAFGAGVNPTTTNLEPSRLTPSNSPFSTLYAIANLQFP